MLSSLWFIMRAHSICNAGLSSWRVGRWCCITDA
jgi:hypothetical protein